jgi:hypothetical protein
MQCKTYKNYLIREHKGSSFLTQDRQCTYNVTLRQVRESFLPWKSNKYYICVCVRAGACACARVHVALRVPHATRTRHIVTSFLAPQDQPHISTLSHKRRDFRKKKIVERKMCALIFFTTFV